MAIAFSETPHRALTACLSTRLAWQLHHSLSTTKGVMTTRSFGTPKDCMNSLVAADGEIETSARRKTAGKQNRFSQDFQRLPFTLPRLLASVPKSSGTP